MDISGLNISAVIPAAGMSTRMHQYKPLLKLGPHTLIEKSILLFQECGIKDIIVVTGHNREKIEPVIKKAGAQPVFNKNFECGMLSSIQAGVKALSEHTHGFFLLPADIPLIRPSTINAVISSAVRCSSSSISSSCVDLKSDSSGNIKSIKDIIIPEFEGEPGHPPLIPAWLIPDILALGEDSNLGKLLLTRQNQQRREKVHDRGILMDADTRPAYESLKERFQRIDIPDIQECRSIINHALEGEERIKEHLYLVADTALAIVRAIENPDPGKTETTNALDINLVMAGAMLHDIKRKEKKHAEAGAKFILSLGFAEVADIVAHHMDIGNALSDQLTEAQIVYFADKVCNGNSLQLDYGTRFKEKILKNPQAKTGILRRYENTKYIQARIEAAAGRSVKSVLG